MLGFFLTAGSDLSFWEKLSVWYKNSVLYELLVYIWDTYFTVHLEPYENFILGPDAGEYARMLVFSISIAIIVSAAMVIRTRNGLGKFVRLLVSERIHTKEQAKTLMELGFFRDATVRRELMRGINLRRIVRCVEEEEHQAAQEDAKRAYDESHKDDKKAPAFEGTRYRIDLTRDHFYIPEELRYRAEVRYEHQGSSWKLMLGAILLAVVLAAVLCRYLPDILKLADNIINMAAPE